MRKEQILFCLMLLILSGCASITPKFWSKDSLVGIETKTEIKGDITAGGDLASPVITISSTPIDMTGISTEIKINKPSITFGSLLPKNKTKKTTTETKKVIMSSSTVEETKVIEEVGEKINYIAILILTLIFGVIIYLVGKRFNKW